MGARKCTKENLPELTAELFLQEVAIVDEPLQISHIADNINAVLIRYRKQKTSGPKLNKLLEKAGFLETTDDGRLTGSGKNAGIIAIRRISGQDKYIQCLFEAQAQQICAQLVLEEIEQA